MAEQWDEFEALLKNTSVPEPREGAEDAALLKAMEQFDQKFANHRQGIGLGNRLMGAVRAAYETLSGAFTMKKTYIIAGGVCASLMAIAVVQNVHVNDFLAPVEVQKELKAVAALPAEEFVQDQVAVDSAPLVLDTPAPAATAPSKQTPPAVVTPPAQFLRQKKDDSLTNILNAAKVDPSTVTASAPPPPPALESAAAPMPESKAEAVMGEPIQPHKGKMATISGIGGALRESGSVVSQPVRMMPPDYPTPYYQEQGRDRFEEIKVNPLKVVKEEPVSTFSIDVDTSSYSFLRAALNQNMPIQKDMVRIEELVNYFPYEYAAPKDKNEPFKASVSMFPTPWNKDTKILHIGIKGYQLEYREKPRSNLVFLIDTSGSMNSPNKLPLVQNSMKLLLDSLQIDDTVAIVTYAGSAGAALPPTRVGEKSKILAALDQLYSAGSTAGAEGIRQAYQLAEQHFVKEGVNRIILATDGDFNVGISDPQELKRYIEEKRKTGIFLSVLGVGMGNYNDALMQALAQNGNGTAAYIDTLSEARKVLVEEAGSTLFPIAKDVKIQVEFNPAEVAEYRLIGYETRLLDREDFDNDKVDAGDIGAGHAVTALYEVTPVGSKAQMVDDLRYQKPSEKVMITSDNGEYGFVKIRYKLPNSDTSQLITTPVDKKVERLSLTDVPADARFATSVAAFGQLLRGDPYLKSYRYDDVLALAEGAKGQDKFGYRAEFINLVRLAKATKGTDGNKE